MQLFSADPGYEKSENLNFDIVKNLQLTKHISELSFNFFNFSRNDFISCSSRFNNSKILIIFTYNEIQIDDRSSSQEVEIQDALLISKRYIRKSIEATERTANLAVTTFSIKLITKLKVLLSYDSKQATYLSSILQTSSTFCRGFCNYLMDREKINELAQTNASSSMILIQLTPSDPPLNYSWCSKLCSLAHRCVVMVEGMNWLSTLGGAYCALADQDHAFVKLAGATSAEQLRIAMDLGDVNMAFKCLLFIALNQIQKGRLKQASILIRFVYGQCNAGGSKGGGGYYVGRLEATGKGLYVDGGELSTPEEGRLVGGKGKLMDGLGRLMVGREGMVLVTERAVLMRMCRGIWSKLQYERCRRKSRKDA